MKGFFFNSSFSFSVLVFFFSCKSQKNDFFSTLWVGLDLGQLTQKVYVFKFSRCFLICRDHTSCTTKSIRSREDKKKNFSLLFLNRRDRARCTAKSIRSREDKKKNFSLLFLIRSDRARCTTKSIRSQGKQQSETKT